MPNEVVERMIRWKKGKRRVRVWRQCDEVLQLAEHIDDICEVCNRRFAPVKDPTFGGMLNIAKEIAKLPRVNAVEVTYKRQGVVYYPDWS